jgi:formylglycine-generating enzyme required for sulfatase activity
MIRKTHYALALILVGLALGACGKKEEAQPQAEQAPAVQTPKITPGEMVLIPAGEYTIGTKEKKNPDGSTSDAYPEHKVKLSAFWIDKYEVTNSEYLDFSINTNYVAEGQSEGKTWRTFFSPDKANTPVVYLTWKDAEAYCKAGGKRLPTEEEWEAAARGSEGLRYPWGNQWDNNRTNTAEAGYRVPMDIGMFDDVSPFGVHDMFGNVQEWTASWLKAYPGNASKNSNYGERFRVVRGLSVSYFGGKAFGLWARSAYLPNYLANFGFRCAKNATPEEAAKAAPAK